MVRKLLILLFVLFIFVFSVSQSQAQTSQDISCSPTTPCPTQINCSVGCLSVSLTCVNGLCRVPSGLLCSNTLGMSNGGCTANNYCTRNPSVGNYTCQISKPNGSSCTDMSECQPNTAFGGDRVCAVNLCGTSPKGASCCPSGKFWCATTGTCTNQGDGSCPCEATTNPPTPTPTSGGTASGPTPTPSATCSSSGIVTKTYNRTGCFSSRDAKSVSVTCNDGTQKTFTSSFGCTDTFLLDSNAKSFCSSHKTCPEPTPTPQTLSCDPVKDGFINEADYDLWLKEYTHQVNTTLTSCFVPGDNTVNILDFQVWKDIKYGLRPANAPISYPPQVTLTPTPSPYPTSTPSPYPTATPSPYPTATPSPFPTATPTATSALLTYITNNNRSGIASWSKSASLAQIKTAVSLLSASQKNSLVNVLLPASVTNATGTDKIRLVSVLVGLLDNPNLAYYIEPWSNLQSIKLLSGSGGGSYGSNVLTIYLTTADDNTYRNTVMHESFHKFSELEATGGSTPIWEGIAIWVYKSAYPETTPQDHILGGLAEGIYGTKNWYRDMENKDFPLQTYASMTQKFRDVVTQMTGNDPSHAAWNDQAKLQLCYDKYYKNLNRNIGDWFAQAAAKSQLMAADPQCN